MTHLSLLLTLLFKNAYFGFGIWLFSMSAAFGYTVLSYYNTNNALLYIPACDAHVE